MTASPPSPPIAALIQMTSGTDPQHNLATIDRAMADAAARGAAMAFLPEMSLLLDRDRARSGAHIVRETDSPWPTALQEMAQKHGLWLHSGSMPLLADDGRRRVNRSHVIAADGSLAGVSLAQSSGNAALDKIALDHIRRSAPFPAPPEGVKPTYAWTFVGK